MSIQTEQHPSHATAPTAYIATHVDLDESGASSADLPVTKQRRRRVSSTKRAEIAEFYRIVMACHLASEAGGNPRGAAGRR